ncbi:MAG: hypothetical protein E2O39_12295 [Planctomycetota bacterium]|nr:MAG: hypothetical protein E2O39_12295 [Planctomycetota bacterium]
MRATTSSSVARAGAAVLALAALACSPEPTNRGAVDERPNIVVIYADDLRFDAAAALGNPYIATPHLDRLAREGVVFERAYVTTSRCCPARASFLAGMYAPLLGILNNHPTVDFPGPHRTFPGVLDEAGYDTAYIGKWHLPNPGAAPRPEFDHWVSFEGVGVYEDQPLIVDGANVETAGFATDILTDYAVRFVERPREQPFLVILALKNCHAPLNPPARHRGLLDDRELPLPASSADPAGSLPAFYRSLREGDDRQRHALGADEYGTFARRYWELVLSIDESVGRILAALERTGELDSTLVVFTSDNGQLLGEHGLRAKGLSYEPSIRVPLVMRYPPLVRAGIRSDELVANIDVAPTLVALAGAEVPREWQGASLLPLFSPGEVEWRRQFLYVGPSFGSGRIIEGALVETDWKYVRFQTRPPGEALFDLARDPDERVDLVADPAYAAELARLRRAFEGELERHALSDVVDL